MQSFLPGVIAASLLLAACQATGGGSTPGPSGGGSGAGGSGGTGGQGGPDPMADADPPFEADPPRPDAPPNPVNVRACTAIRNGAAAPVAVTGQELFTIEAPAIASDEKLYRIAIPPRAGAPSHVTFTAPAAGEYVLFASAPVAVPVAVFALDGELLDIKLRLRVPECPEVNGRHTVTLQAMKYVIRLGPERLPSVDVVVMPTTPP